MSFASMDTSADSAPLTDINVVPLIDVMLVLLVIFLITAPVRTHAVKVALPLASSTPNTAPPDAIQIAIDASNLLHWNGSAVDENTLNEHLRAVAALQPQPEVHIHAERTTPYGNVAQVMSNAARAGVLRIGFMTIPE